MYALDIMKANNAADTSTSDKWELVLDYVKDYDLNGFVTPDEMHKLAKRVGDDRSFASIYRWQMMRNVIWVFRQFSFVEFDCPLT